MSLTPEQTAKVNAAVALWPPLPPAIREQLRTLLAAPVKARA